MKFTLQWIVSEATEITDLTAALLARLVRYANVTKDAAEYVEKMIAEYEPLRRSGKANHDKLTRDIITEWTRPRELAAGAALFDLEPRIDRLASAVEAFTQDRRHDVSLSMPLAFNHMGPGDMVSAAILRQLTRPAIEAMTVDELLAVYQRGLEGKDAEGFINVELIEQRLARREGIARTEEDLPASQRLKFIVDQTQGDRVPTVELTEVAETLEAARKAVNRAKLLNVLPVNVDHHPGIRAAVERELAEVAG